MFPFWMDFVWSSLPHLCVALGAAAAMWLHVTIGYR